MICGEKRAYIAANTVYVLYQIDTTLIIIIKSLHTICVLKKCGDKLHSLVYNISY